MKTLKLTNPVTGPVYLPYATAPQAPAVATRDALGSTLRVGDVVETWAEEGVVRDRICNIEVAEGGKVRVTLRFGADVLLRADGHMLRYVRADDQMWHSPEGTPPITPTPTPDVLAQPERHQQPEQRHYAQAECMTGSDATVRPERAEIDALRVAQDVAHAAYQGACTASDACFASSECEGWQELLNARQTAFSSWMDAQAAWMNAITAYHGLDLPLVGPTAQPEQQQAQLAREIETGYPEAGYQTLAEGLRRLAAGRKALPAPLTYEQAQTRWRAHMAEATRLQESLRTAPLEQVEGIRQQVHAELRECQRLTDLEQALLGEVRW